VKIVRVIIWAILFGLIGLAAGGVGWGKLESVFLTDRFVDSVPSLLLLAHPAAVWLFSILVAALGAALGGYVGYRITRSKDK
jgi:hypothetical protein